jgi:hypothetical protein
VLPLSRPGILEADDQGDQTILRNALSGDLRDFRTVAQDDDAIRELEHVRKDVTDDHDRCASFPYPPDEVENGS